MVSHAAARTSGHAERASAQHRRQNMIIGDILTFIHDVIAGVFEFFFGWLF